MSNIYNILKVLRPNNNWSTTNNTFTWEDDIALKPTDAEIEAKRIELQNEAPMKKLRKERNIKLSQCDKYSITEWPHPSEEVKQAWVTYRQELRDLPSTAFPKLNSEYDLDLTSVTWPTEPS